MNKSINMGIALKVIIINSNSVTIKIKFFAAPSILVWTIALNYQWVIVLFNAVKQISCIC